MGFQPRLPTRSQRSHIRDACRSVCSAPAACYQHLAPQFAPIIERQPHTVHSVVNFALPPCESAVLDMACMLLRIHARGYSPASLAPFSQDWRVRLQVNIGISWITFCA